MVCTLQVSMTFGCWAMTLISRSCDDPFDENVHCCGSFQLFSTSMINLAIWDSNAIWQWMKSTASRWPPSRSYDVIAGHENIHVNNSSQNRLRAVGAVPLCLSRKDASTVICNMHYLGHSSGQVIWPDLRSNFKIDLSGSKCMWFNASRRYF